MAAERCLVAVILTLIPLVIASPRLDPKFSHKYDVEADLSLDSFQGTAPDAAELSLKATVTLDPVASPDLWSLHLSSVKVQGEGKKTEIQKDTENLFVQFTESGTDFYLKDGVKESSFTNILKAVAQLFHSGDDSSCTTTKEEVNGQKMTLKTNCHFDKSLNKHSNHPLGIVANVQRRVDYREGAKNILEEVSSHDLIEYSLSGNKETKSRVDSNLKLKFVGMGSKTAGEVSAKDLLKTLKKVQKEFLELPRCDESHCSKLKDFVEFRKDDFDKANMGTDRLALSTLRTILDIQPPSEKDVEKLLSGKKIKSIRGQILDVLGALQTWETYSGVLASLMDKEEAVDDLERYFQTLAVGLRPQKRIMEDILQRLSKDKVKNEKLKSTLILTLSSMTFNYAQTANFDVDLIDSVDTFLWENFEKCKELDCRARFLRGYLNMKLVNRIPDLLSIVQKEPKILGTIAMKSLQHFPFEAFSEKSKKILQSIFHQTIRRYDSSLRTLALDILMKGEMTEEVVQDLLQALKQKDKSYEVKQYLLERFKLRAGECETFLGILSRILQSDSDLNNYHRIATGGLTTALSRQFLAHPSFNSSIISVQEIQKGVLKRGIVDMFFTGGGGDEEQEKFSYFTLELYARGMANMMGGGGGEDDKDEGEPAEEETLTAGMELIVHGQSLRPLEFFNGQGELMGHVWSGTASDPTPAYQATTLFFDHRFSVPLQSGFVVQFDLMTGISIDLTGQVSLSLWNRNGKSKVGQSIGLATVGRTTVATDFSRTVSEFRVLQSPKLNLISDFEFSGNNLLCLQLSQPGISLKKVFWKKNAIPALKISDEKEKSYSFEISGNSHLLNAKNNEMCRNIHNEL